ncbi:MAG TPA: hypothetical protein VHJ18_02560 [Streptosporangiaceae bacterium]|jgi:hypothetical protein|nr:hypothetical protein [Streptosporangiaceae bacterium]
MLATVIAESIGWDGELTVLKDQVREMRPVHLHDNFCDVCDVCPGHRNDRVRMCSG